MHLRAQLLQALLVADAKMLLLVDDQQAKVAELDRLAEQRVGADDDVDAALGEVLLDLVELLGRDQPRGLRDVDGEAAETFGKSLGVLARQERGRHDHGDLLAVERRGKGRTQRHLGLAEADVAADQAVHRTPGLEVLQRGVDGVELVLGLLIGETGAELVIDMRLHREFRRFVQHALGRDLDQLACDLADAILQLRFARLPAAAAEPVQLDLGLVGAVARQQFDVLDRQEKLGLVGIMQLEAVMRRAADFQRLQADEAADAVVDMDDNVAGGEARDLGDEVVELAACLARPHQAVAKDVLLADDGDVVGLEAAFHAEHGEHGLVARRGLHRAPGVDAGDVGELVIGEHARHAVARALAPQRDHDFLALGLQRLDVGDDALRTR